MNQGYARKITIFDFSTAESHVLVARPSAWKQAVRFEASHEVEEVLKNAFSPVTWAYFAAKQAGLADALSLPEELTVETLEDLFDRLAVSIEDVGDEDIPLILPPK